MPAIGFAAGIERLIVAGDAEVYARPVDVYVATLGGSAAAYGVVLGRDLRAAGAACEVDARETKLGAKLRRASALGAKLALIAGDTEVAEASVQLKDLASQSQEKVTRDAAVGVVIERLGAKR